MVKAIKNKRWLVLLAKIMLLALVLYFFYTQLERIDWNRWELISIHSFWPILVCIALVFLNWYLEYLKWLQTLQFVAPETDLNTRIKSFMAGILTGFITPNLLGNFIGRIFYFDSSKRATLVGITLLSNAAQFLASILFGLVSIFLIGFPFQESDDLPQIWKITLLLCAILLLLFYFLFRKMPAFFKRWQFFKQFEESLKAPFALRIKLLLLSLLRHSVFSFQFVLLLNAFGNFPIQTMFLVWQVYFWSTLIPSLWFGKLVIRESVALWIFGHYTDQLEAVLIASVLLWLLNQGLTALVGLPFVRFKNKES